MMNSHALWFNEFKICMELYRDGFTSAEIKEKSKDDNVLQMPSKDRARRAVDNLTKRIEALPSSIKEIFFSLNVENQKIVALLSLMLTNRLLDEFCYEVLRNEMIVGSTELANYKVVAFMQQKQAQDEQLANWSEQTAKRARNMLITFLKDAGLITTEGRTNIINHLFYNNQLIAAMKEAGLTYELAGLGEV